jgi:hypothetical protein
MPRTTKQVLAEQKKQVDRDRASRQAVAPIKPAMPAVPDSRTPQEKYLDEIAPSGIVGRLIKFSKEGKFVFSDTDEQIDEKEDFVCLCDQTLVSWVRFNDGEAPTRIGGLLYQGFSLPPRAQLGNENPGSWPIGLSGKPEDPWKQEQLLVLRRPATLELATFSTMSKTGRRAVGTLLKHYNRLRTDNPGAYPVVRLRPSGYQDSRYGWVNTPSFVPVGVAAGLSADVPDTSLKAQLNDAIGF